MMWVAWSLPLPARDLIILGTPEPPFKMLSASSEVEGIDVDIIKTVFNQMGLSYQINLVDSGSRILQEAKTGRADVVLSLSWNEEREFYLQYPTQSYKSVAWNFFIRQSDKSKIRYNTFDDLKDYRIGAAQDWSYTKEFWNAPLKRIVVTDNQLLIPMLLRNRVDVVPMNTAMALFEARLNQTLPKLEYLPKPIKIDHYYNAFSKHGFSPKELNDIVKDYSKILSQLIENGEIDSIYSKYGTTRVTGTEQANRP